MEQAEKQTEFLADCHHKRSDRDVHASPGQNRKRQRFVV